MSKVENSRLELVDPLYDFSTEISLVEQCLQELGFSEKERAWLVAIFKRPDCFGDPTGE